MNFNCELEIGETYWSRCYKNYPKQGKLEQVIIEKNGPLFVFSDGKDVWSTTDQTAISTSEEVVLNKCRRMELHMSPGVF